MRSSVFMKFFVVMALGSSLTEAQVVRTWVASNGSDANPCSRTLPCRNFAAAVSAVDPGGEVVVLDSAGYGPVSITKNVAVIAPEGIHAAIAPTSGTAISVSGSTVVILRNLYLNSRGATTGLQVLGADKTFAEDLTINGFGGSGIALETNQFYLDNSVSRNNGMGLFASQPGGQMLVFINRSRFENNDTDGVRAGPNSEVTVRDSLATGNYNAGFWAGAPGIEPVQMSLMNCQASRNFYGVVANRAGDRSDPMIRVSYSAAVHNRNGFYEAGFGQIESQGNNFVQGNGSNVIGTITVFSGT